MRKLVIIIAVIILFIGILISSHFFGDHEVENSYGLAVIHKSLESIIEDSELIIIGISGDSEIIEIKSGNSSFKGISYEVQIDEILYNRSNFDFEENDIIRVTTINYTKTDNGWSEIFPINEMETGEYLFFLNSINNDGELYFVNNTPNHLYEYSKYNILYKLKGKKYKNINGRSLKKIYLKELKKELESK